MHTFFMRNFLDWVDLSTFNQVPERCSVSLNLTDAAMRIKPFEPPAGWSVTPDSTSYWPTKELLFIRNGCQDCTVDVNL